MLFLQNSNNLPNPDTQLNAPTWWWVGMFVLIAVLALPWIALLIYSLTVKYRVRVYSNGFLVSTQKFKAKTPLSELQLPTKEGYIIEGLYRDEEFILPLEHEVMPKQNLKLYIKWQEK